MVSSPARWPRYLDAWAQLGMLARDDTEAYACFRVGYHRGLDRLRANGWRGSGYVRWVHEENRGFLRSLRGLGQTADRIGEHDEAERCAHFLMQCDPTGVPAEGWPTSAGCRAPPDPVVEAVNEKGVVARRGGQERTEGAA